MSPFRQNEFEDVENLIRDQMIGACRMLKEWQKFWPVVAGGALWSWAAKEPARDVDIFVRRSWRTRRWATRRYGVFGDEDFRDRKLIRSGYSSRWTNVGVPVSHYKTVLPGDTATPVDFVLTPWKGCEVIKHFDYFSSCVAWGSRGSSVFGASYYRDGAMTAQFEGGRDKDYVRGKVKEALWGKEQAEERLSQIFVNLSHIYHIAV